MAEQHPKTPVQPVAAASAPPVPEVVITKSAFQLEAEAAMRHMDSILNRDKRRKNRNRNRNPKPDSETNKNKKPRRGRKNAEFFAPPSQFPPLPLTKENDGFEKEYPALPQVGKVVSQKKNTKSKVSIPQEHTTRLSSSQD